MPGDDSGGRPGSLVSAVSMFEVTGTFFQPLWRRIVLVAFLLVWTAMEFLSGAPFWGMLVLGLASWSVYEMFFKPRPTNVNSDDD